MVQKKGRTKSSSKTAKETAAAAESAQDNAPAADPDPSSLETTEPTLESKQDTTAASTSGNDAATHTETGPNGPIPVRRVGRRRAAGPSRNSAAANDDVPSIGGLIYALQQKPSRRPFTIAAVMSASWLFISAVLIWLTLGSEIIGATPVSEIVTRPQFVLIAAAAILPVALFWFLAVLIWRAQELRLMSSAMTEVAVRLAEPDRLAEQSVASLGQTVRRQVMSMNDAINRSLGRAGELEALVHSEVAAIERAYHENEVRVRSLINELISERESLTNNSDRVSDTIRGIGLEVTQEIAKASDVAANSLSAATKTLANEVQKSGSQLTARIQATNDQTAYLMSESGNTLLASLGDMNKRIGAEVPSLLDKLAGEQTRLTKVVEGAGRNLAALETALGDRVESLDASLGEKTETLRDALQNKIKDFDDTFTDKARALDSAIGEKMGQFDNAITDKAKTFYQALEKTSTAMDRSILDRTRSIETAMQRQAGHVDGAIGKGIEAVHRASENITTQSVRTLDGLTRQGESLRSVSESLLTQIRDLTERFDHQGQNIMRAANSLESSNFRIDSVLENRHAELSGLLDEITNRAQALDGALRSHSDTIDATYTQIDNASAHNSSSADLRQRFLRATQDASREMGDLSGGLSRSSQSGDTEHRRNQIRRELDQLPSTPSASTEAARRSLQEQLHALDGPTSGYGSGTSNYQPPASTSLGRAMSEPALSTDSSTPQAPNNERWSLGDLLSRASDDMPLPVPTRPDGQSSVGTVALDLQNMARAIDTQTATNIWSRLNAGERNLLDRGIYTIDGQTTFDEIGRRYVSDMAFRDTVNRYLVDFEQLLREVDQKDPGGNVVRNHLVSEMGRVYLLLAHASGRLS